MVYNATLSRCAVRVRIPLVPLKIRVSYNGIIQAFGSCDLGSTPNTLTNILRYGVMEAHVVLVHTVQVRALVSQQLTRNDPQREVTCFGCRVIAGSSPVYATKIVLQHIGV